jgi:hypothetical protein
MKKYIQTRDKNRKNIFLHMIVERRYTTPTICALNDSNFG